MRRFADRTDAGRALAQALSRYAGRRDVIVLALPRGGVVVGYEVARALDAPLDVFLVRKLGVPGQEELAMGAIATGGVRVMNDDVVRSLSISDEQIERVAETEQAELERRETAYRAGRAAPEVRGRTVLLVDDGLATGASMKAAISALKTMRPAAIVVAVPTAPEETCAAFERLVDELVCLTMPVPFYGVGGSYSDFSQTTRPGGLRPACSSGRTAIEADGGGHNMSGPRDRREGLPVTITTDSATLQGDLAIPEGATGIVVFAHGSGSSRKSPRNQLVARELRGARPGHAAVRPADGRGGRGRQRHARVPLRHRPAGPAARRRHRLAGRAAADAGAAGRLLRRQHGRGGGADGRCGAAERRARRRLARRPAGPGRAGAAQGAAPRPC